MESGSAFGGRSRAELDDGEVVGLAVGMERSGPPLKEEPMVLRTTLVGVVGAEMITIAVAVDDRTFREMARSHPKVAQLRELRHALSQLRLRDLAVGRDEPL